MESSSNFLDVIVGWLHEMGLPSINQFEAVQLLIAVLLILVFLVWLILRKVRLWYWKKNEEIDMLKSINIHLKNLDERLSVDTAEIAEKIDGKAQAENEESGQPNQELQPGSAPEEEGQTAVGRSGRLYTETELELLIRD